MRYLILNLVALLWCGLSYGQNLDHESKIKDFLGEDRFQYFQETNPSHLVYLDTKYSQGYSILSSEPEKMIEIKRISTFQYKLNDGTIVELSPTEFVQMYEDGSLNLLRIALPYDQNKDTYYQIGDTGKVLVLHAAKRIVEATNEKTQTN